VASFWGIPVWDKPKKNDSGVSNLKPMFNANPISSAEKSLLYVKLLGRPAASPQKKLFPLLTLPYFLSK
jgi:hypothetical protein